MVVRAAARDGACRSSSCPRTRRGRCTSATVVVPRYGAVLANILEAAGFAVEREYYVNDAGRQMDILAASLLVRYLQARGGAIGLPANAYQGAYIVDMANVLVSDSGDTYTCTVAWSPDDATDAIRKPRSMR